MPDAAETKAKNEKVNAYFINGYCFTLSVTLYIIINKINIILEYLSDLCHFTFWIILKTNMSLKIISLFL